MYSAKPSEVAIRLRLQSMHTFQVTHSSFIVDQHAADLSSRCSCLPVDANNGTNEQETSVGSGPNARTRVGMRANADAFIQLTIAQY